MPNNGFLPSQDAALLAWSLNFSTRITSTPSAYGLVAGDATSYSALHASFASALAACDPDERNKITTASKNSARLSLKNSARLLAKRVEGTAAVTDAQKLELGLNVRATPTPIPPPSTAPVIEIISTVGRTVKLKLKAASGDDARGKPDGVDGASVFSFVGAAAPTEESEWNFEGVTSKTKMDIVFPETIAPGAKVWFTAFWFNGRKQNGPASTAVGINIPGGSAMAA